MYYESEVDYIDKCEAKDRVVAIDACITALITTVLKAAGTANVQEYRLSDGQTEIKKIYRNPQEVMVSVSLLRMLRQQFINDINSGVVILTNAKNIIGWQG